LYDNITPTYHKLVRHWFREKRWIYNTVCDKTSVFDIVVWRITSRRTGQGSVAIMPISVDQLLARLAGAVQVLPVQSGTCRWLTIEIR